MSALEDLQNAVSRLMLDFELSTGCKIKSMRLAVDSIAYEELGHRAIERGYLDAPHTRRMRYKLMSPLSRIERGADIPADLVSTAKEIARVLPACFTIDPGAAGGDRCVLITRG